MQAISLTLLTEDGKLWKFTIANSLHVRIPVTIRRRVCRSYVTAIHVSVLYVQSGRSVTFHASVDGHLPAHADLYASVPESDLQNMRVLSFWVSALNTGFSSRFFIDN